MELQKRIALVKEVGEEIVTEEDLASLLSSKKEPVAYDGFEPSGKIHVAQGIMRAINVNKMTAAGCRFKMLVADWHAWANNKFGGDLDKIQTAGKYFIEVWKSSGMNLDRVEFVWASELASDDSYWKKVVQIARNASMARMVRCCEIMGRKESEALTAAQILYPCMQCADIFHLGADIAQLGMDQRKVNVLAREIGPKLGYGKPVIVSHHMLMGLKKPVSNAKDACERAIELKMSKSIPDSAIFMTDSREELSAKIQKAYCPERQVAENPMMEYMKYIIFQKFDSIVIEREERFGGDLAFNSYEELARVYGEGSLHPADLKKAVSRYLDMMISPVREHFEKNAKARELLAQVSSYTVTR